MMKEKIGALLGSSIYGGVMLVVLTVALLLPAPTASADTQIEVEVQHLLMKELDNGVLEIREVFSLVNQGEELPYDPSIPPEEQLNVEFSLPESFFNLQVNQGLEDDGELVPTARGWGLAKDIPTGELRVEFEYHLEQGMGEHYLFEKEIIYPTEDIYFLTPDSLAVQGERIVFAGQSPMGEVNFNYFYYENPQVGDGMKVAVTVGQGAEGLLGDGTQTPTAQDPDSNLERGYTNTGFHSPAHIRFWNKSPFSGIEPHLFMAVLVAGMLGLLFITIRKVRTDQDDISKGLEREAKKSLQAQQVEELDKLVAKEKVLMKKITEASQQLAKDELDQETFDQLLKVYKEKLVEVRVKIKMQEK